MPPKPSITIVIPALNDQETITKIVKDCIKFSPLTSRILVVIDSKTTDKTEKLAKEAGAKVIHVGKNRGKGYAFRKSIAYIDSIYCVQIDSDYQFLPKDLKKIVSPLQDGFDLSLGTRYQIGSHVEKGSVSLLKLFGSWFLSGVTSVIVRQRITDVMAGFKGFRTDSLKKIKLTTDHFGYEAEVVIKASKKGMKIANVPISYRKRKHGRSNVSSINHGVLVLETIFKSV